MPGTPDDLARHDLLVVTAGSQCSGWRLSRGSEHHRVETPARLKGNNSFPFRDAAKEGLGVAQLPLMVANEGLGWCALLRVLPDWTPPAIPVQGLLPSGRYLNPKVRAFIDLAVEAFVQVVWT